MTADFKERPASLSQAGKAKLKSKEVFDDIANKLVQSTAAEESGFRLIRGGEEGGKEYLKRYSTT